MAYPTGSYVTVFSAINGSPGMVNQFRVLKFELAISSSTENDAADNAIIKPEEHCLLPISIIPPPYSGSFFCAFHLEIDGEIANNVLGGASEVIPVASVALNTAKMLPIDLKQYFSQDNTIAAVAEGRGKINFDGQGNSFPLAEFLPDYSFAPYGYSPGYAANSKY